MLTPMELYFPVVSCENVQKVLTPVLLVGGDRSPPMFRPILSELAKCLPKVERVVIRHAGHNMQIDNPAEFNTEVLTFLRKY